MPENEIDGKVTIALLGQQLTHISTQLEKLTSQVATILIGGSGRDEKITSLCLLLRDYRKIEEHVLFMLPWVRVLRWFLVIAGGVVAAAIIGGIMWAVAQSGGLLP